MGWFGRKGSSSSGGGPQDDPALERFARASGGPYLSGWDDRVPVTVPGAPAGSRVERLVGARVRPNPLGMQYEHLLVLYDPAGEVRAVITAETAAGLHDDCYFAMFADGRHTNFGAAPAMRGAEGLDVFLGDALPMAAEVLNTAPAAPAPATPQPAPEPVASAWGTSGPATQPVPIVSASMPAPLDADVARARLAELRRESDRIDPGRLRELGDLLQTLGAAAVADRLRRAANAFDDPRELHLAGYELVDAGLADLAVPALRRALALRPGDIDSLCELVIALEHLERYGEAAALMAAHPQALDQVEVLRALFANDAALSGDLDAARAMYPRLSPDGELGVLHRTTELRLARADALAPLGRPRADDLRGWELILNGITVLDVADAEYEGMGGRWAMVWDNRDSLATRLTMLLQVLARASRPVSVVAHGLDRDSEILAWAIGVRLGRPVVPLDGDVPPHALLALYTWTPRVTADGERLRVADPTATLFGYCLDWTAGAQPAPDVVGLEAQALFPVWGAGSRVVGEIGTPDARVVATPPDDRDPEVIGRELAAVRGNDEAPQQGDVFALIDALRAAGAGSGLTTGERHRHYSGGPVSSLRFER